MDSLTLLQSYFNNKQFDFTGDVKTEIDIQNKQSLAPYLYFVYGNPFLKTFIAANIIQEKFFHLQKEITSIFNSNKIKHYYLKGSVLAKLYPEAALRTRGDIDVVVEDGSYDRAILLLKKNSFIATDKTLKDTSLIKDNLLVEVHKKLVDSGKWLYDYFDDGFKYATPINDYEYTLNNEFHYIYLVYHLNKHLITGEGLRPLLDFYYLNKSFNLDYDYIEKELDKINLLNLYHHIANCLYVITNEKLPGYTGEDVSELLNYMLENGVHGKCDSNNYFNKYLIVNNESKTKYIIKALFINKEQRKALYPKLSKCILFYPIIIIHRFFFLLFNRKGYIKALLKPNKNNIYEKSFFDKFGILDNS